MAISIAVTGKGGTGKTVVAALVIKYLREKRAGTVLALDADPDSNLGTVLGLPVAKTVGDLREETRMQLKNLPPGMSKSVYVESGLHEIIVESEGLDLITMGRSEGQGCYCYINSLLRAFAEDLDGFYDWIVMDNEAGLEHLSRGTAPSMDNLIVVVNGSPLSVDCARRIDRLIGQLRRKVGRKYYVVNNVSDARCEQIQKMMDIRDMVYLGCIPRDESLAEYVFNRRSLLELTGSPAAGMVAEMVQRIIDAGQSATQSCRLGV